MPKLYPGRMNYLQWRRTPFRTKHRLLGLKLNYVLGYWRDCENARCRRARRCQDYECYWRRLAKLPPDKQARVRAKVEEWGWTLWEGDTKGSQGRMRY